MLRRGPVLTLLLWAALLALIFAAPAGAATPRTVFPVVGSTTTSSPISAGFLGFSMEMYSIHEYAGSNPNAIDPVFLQLIRNLNPGQAPVLRLGGNSSDQSWWQIPGVLAPRGISYPLTRGWVRVVSATARALGAKLIVGLNLRLDSPTLTTAEARALRSGLGSSLYAFELGNEPDLYGVFPWYETTAKQEVFARNRFYSVTDFLHDLKTVGSGLPPVPMAGPSFASMPWMASGIAPYIDATKNLGIVTVHRYPLRACDYNPTDPAYPTIANLLSDYSETELAGSIQPYVEMAHARGLPFRVDELNSASCTGAAGVSNTQASAIWMLDTLFEFAQAGVQGVNVHTLQGARYSPFNFSKNAGGTWQGSVFPDYYGMLMFAQAAPPGSKLLSISNLPDGLVKAWATLAPDGTERVVLINQDVGNAQTAALQAPGTTATAEVLSGPGATATGGITLGGQSFGGSTTTGVLGPMHTATINQLLGSYSVTIPPASAVLLTLH